MHWPQYVYLGLVTLGVVGFLVRDGRPRTGHYSAAADLIGAAISLWLLWMGGFFG